MKHIEDPEATDPDDLAMVLAHDLLPFYKVWARSPEPPAEDQHIPTLVDLQMIVIPILKDKSMSDYKSTPDEKSKLQHIKCMTILREVDDCYGGKGWAGPLPTSNTNHDSGIVPDMFQSDQSSQSKSIPSGPDTALVPRGKRPRDPTISTTKPAKRPRSESVLGQAALQPHMISSNMSSDRTEDPSPQSLLQGRSEMPSNIPTPSVTQTSQTPDDYETILRPETRRVLQEPLVAEVEEIHARLAMTEAKRVEINNQQATLVQADASLSRRKPKKRRTRCLLKKHCKEGMKACDGDTKDELGMMQHIERSHFPPNIFICPVCYHKSIRKDSFISHFDKRHGESYDDEAKRDKLKKRVIIKEIDDTYCDICPLCMEKVELNSRKEFMTHIKEHVEGKLDNYPYTDRCSSKTNHNWKKSSCIPEEYRQEIEGRKKRRKSCRPSDQDFHDDQENDDSDDEEDPSDPPPPRDRSSQGPSGQNGGRASGRAITYFSSGNDGRPYASPYRSEMATMPSSFARMPGNSNSSLHINSQRTNPRTTIPGINLIKRCFKSIRNLGRGGFGAVDEVVCKSTDQSYARKIIPLSQTSTRVSTEVEILKQLRHQNIIHLAAHCTTPDQQLWLFTTPVAKANLATYLRADIKCRALPDRELLPSWEGDLASALKYIHGRGIIHGDIKPQNILVSSDMKIYLADFGSARAKDAQQSHGTEAKPVLALTPKYSAPEVSYYKSVGYSWETGAAADVFSLGGVWAEIETVYTGLSIHAFETFRSSGSVYNSFQANLPRTYLWLDFLWVLQESVLQTSRCWTHAPNTLQTAKDMLSFDPHQRPNADQLTTVLHCTCNVDSPVQPTSDLACYSDPLNKEYPYYWPNEPLPANNINMILRSKLSSYWNPITEGFSPDGRIDISYNWDRDMPTQTLSPWLEDCTDSAAPVFFRSKLDVRKSTSDISKNLRMSDVDQTDSFPILLGKSSLQVM
jgi:serine/threonine protein kinase